MKLLPTSISDFKTIIDNNYYYIDKTLLIKEIASPGAVTLIPRPRRFGKTLNLSMLKYFFEKTEIDNSYLFKNTEIWKYPQFKEEQGKYPVIFLTFKDIKESSWEAIFVKFKLVIAKEFEYHFENIKNSLSDVQLKEFNEIREKKADSSTFSNSILFLSEMLYKHYKTKIIILIDEYDAPIHAGYNNKFYKEVVDFMRSLLSGAFKDNPNLERGILTGILRTAKEGILSGLNNLKVASILNNQFQDKFGFTTDEVKKLLADQNMPTKFNEAQQWYNGYTFGETTIYNPWSIISFVEHNGEVETYWGNTSDNQLIKNIIAISDISVKEKLELILADKSIVEEIDDVSGEAALFVYQGLP